jgi:protein ImuA
MSRPKHIFSALRQRIARPDPAPLDKADGVFALGAERVDQRLHGGLTCAALHEIFAEEADAGAAMAFAIILALRGGALAKPILWIREDRVGRQSGGLYGPGLVALGADPDSFIFVHAPDELATLRAGADSVKCGGLGAVVIEPYGKARALDLTASRRLALAAGASGVLTLLLRVGAEPMPSAAQTRWHVAAAPSVSLEANAPGAPMFDLTLLRHRAGIAGFTARLEWDREKQICVEQSGRGQALSGGVSTIARFGEGQAKAA